MTEGVGNFDNLSTSVSTKAEDLTKDAEVTAAFLQVQAIYSGDNRAAISAQLSLRLDMITTTLKNIKHAPALAENVFLSYKQAESLAANYNVPLSDVLAMGQQYNIAIGPQSDPYNIGADVNGDAMRMVIPVEGNGPGEYIESKISALDVFKNEYYLAHPFETRQQQHYTRDISRDSLVGKALSQFYSDYADYQSSRGRNERDKTERPLENHIQGSVNEPHRSPDWRSVV